MNYATTFSFWKYLGSAIVGSLLIFAVFGIVFVMKAGGVSQLVERKLNNISDNLVFAVSDVGVGVQLSARPLVVKIYDIHMRVDKSTVRVPAAEFEFGSTSLTTGQPEKLVLRGLDLDLVKTADGWSLPKIMGISGALMNRMGQSNELKTGLALRKIGIDAVKMTLSDATGALPKVRFSNLYFDFESLITGDLVGSIRGRHVAEGSRSGDFTATFKGWPGSERFAVDMTAQQLNVNEIASYIDQIPIDLKRIGTLSGHVGVNFENSQINLLEVDVGLQNGVLDKFIVLTEPRFTSANIIGTYARSQKTFKIAKSEIVMADGREFAFIGSVNDIGASLISFAGRLQAGNLALQTILADWPDDIAAYHKSLVRSHLNSGYLKQGNLQIAGQFSPSSRAIILSQFDFDGQFSGLRVNFATDQYRRAVGTVDGNFFIQLGALGEITNLNLDAILTDGSVLLAGRDDPVIVNSAYLQTQFADGKAAVDNLTVDFGLGGKLSMSAKVEFDNQKNVESSSVEVNTNDFDATLFASLWPAQAATRTRLWIYENIMSGRIRSAKLKLGTRYDAEAKKQKLDNIAGTWRLEKTTLSWSKNSPLFTDLSADLTIDNATFVANLTNAQLIGMNVQHGNLTISPVVGGLEPEASLSIAMKGALARALDRAKTSGMQTLANIDISDVLATGEAELILRAAFPLGEKIDFLRAVQKLDATISNGSFANLPGGIYVDNAELVVVFDKDSSTISGTALVMDAPGEFSVYFDQEKELIKVVGLASPSQKLTTLLANTLNLRLGGLLGGKFVYTGDLVKKTAELQVAAPLKGVSVDVPSLNWAKLPAEAGQASMAVYLNSGELAAINNIDIVAGSLAVKGQIAFDTTGAVQAGFFERVAWPGNDIRDLIVEANQDKSWQVGASAKIIDLVPLRRNQGVSGGETINFDFTADQIIVDNQISLSGQLVGARSANGAGSADFSGSLLVRGKPLITEAQFGIVFGAGDEAIEGVGLIGGGETNFNFVDGTGSKPKLFLASKNGGRMLSGLGITDTVRGGDAQLETIFESEDYKTYKTRIDIEDFAVVEAPRAVRALSVLSLAGLYSLVEGDGTAFNVGQAELETRGAIVNIKSLKASGDAVAVSMLGVYDRATKQVNVSGNLVPASQISKIAGKLPLIGNVLTGVDKTGIFTTQFRVTGQSDDMKTSINAASVAPGLLRDLLSPNWLGKERDRLFRKKQIETTGSDSGGSVASDKATAAK